MNKVEHIKLSSFKTKNGSYPLLKVLGEGTFGKVYATCDNKIVKYLKPSGGTEEKQLITEVTLQQKLSEKEEGVCPKVYDFGKVGSAFMIVMEKCEGTARDFLKSPAATEEDFLDYFEQMAKILQRLEKYQFNHRDLKSDNVMYKTVDGKKKYLLIDFGFSCATFDGKKYAGTSYFTEQDECFRRSRDLAQLVFESLYESKRFKNIQTFSQLLLTFKIMNDTCDMTKGCAPYFNGSWSQTYSFLNRPSIENPNTTPEGLLKAVASYRQGGLQACKAGFVVNPVDDTCVPIPAPPAPAALQEAKSPVQHMSNPNIIDLAVSSTAWPRTKSKTAKRKSTGLSTHIRRMVSKRRKELKPASTRKSSKKVLSPCPPGKVRNPKTKKCIKATATAKRRAGVVGQCPQGKILNSLTGRCVDAKGEAGKKAAARQAKLAKALQPGMATPPVIPKVEIAPPAGNQALLNQPPAGFVINNPGVPNPNAAPAAQWKFAKPK